MKERSQSVSATIRESGILCFSSTHSARLPASRLTRTPVPPWSRSPTRPKRSGLSPRRNPSLVTASRRGCRLRCSGRRSGGIGNLPLLHLCRVAAVHVDVFRRRIRRVPPWSRSPTRPKRSGLSPRRNPSLVTASCGPTERDVEVAESVTSPSSTFAESPPSMLTSSVGASVGAVTTEAKAKAAAERAQQLEANSARQKEVLGQLEGADKEQKRALLMGACDVAVGCGAVDVEVAESVTSPSSTFAESPPSMSRGQLGAAERGPRSAGRRRQGAEAGSAQRDAVPDRTING
jgi:hypothetical protein